MKITKRQLRRIIKEERARLLSESQTAGPPISGDHAIALGGSYGGPDLGGANTGDDLYTNLSDDQLGALDSLEDALEACLEMDVSDENILDTVNSKLNGSNYSMARIKARKY